MASMSTPREDVQSLLARYTFGTIMASFQPRVYVDSGPPYPRRHGRVRCVLELTAPERDSGEPYVVRIGFQVQHGATPDTVHPAIMRAFWDHITHELNEGLRFDGELVFRAHQRDKMWWP